MTKGSSPSTDKSIQQPSGNINIPTRSYWNYGGVLAGSYVLFFIALVIFVRRIFDFASSAMVDPTVGFPPIFYIFPIFGLLTSLAHFYYAYYIFVNFDDLASLQNASHGPDVYPKPLDPILPVVLLFVFAPATFFIKYSQLRKHLNSVHNQSGRAPSPIVFILVWILSGITAVAVIPVAFTTQIFYAAVPLLLTVLFAIYLLNMESKWQQALNDHIRHHQV